MPESSPSLCQGLFLCSTSVTIISFKDCPGLGLLKDVSPILPEYILPDVHIYLYCQNLCVTLPVLPEPAALPEGVQCM